MKLTLKGTVRGISPTDTTDFTNGTQVVSLWVTDSEHRGRRLELPLVPHAHTRELGALYRVSEAVTITIEAGEDDGAYLPEIETRLRASDRLRATVQKLTTDYADCIRELNTYRVTP